MLTRLRECRVHAASVALASSLVLTGVAPAHAEPSPRDQARAAQEFDSGVSLFEAAEYEAAARAFLRADVIAPNSEAVSNAIAAARKVNNHLLVAEAAERGISRQSADPGLGATARQALAEAARHLARVELSCDPTPCEVWMDGAKVAPGVHWAVPGTHGLAATRAGAARVEETHSLLAATTYRVALHVNLPGSSAQAATVAITKVESEPPSPEQTPAQSAATPTPKEEPAPKTPRDSGTTSRKGLSPTWFYVSAAVTAGLAGVWIWSGIDTLSANGDLPDNARLPEIDDVQGMAIRTDVLLGGTVVLGAVTAYLGLAGVDWGGNAESALVVTRDGALLSTCGTF
jgi:hypothetical protein